MQPILTEGAKLKYFTSEQINALNMSAIPQHVAIILDGNRRWALQHGASHSEGHRHGADILLDIVRAAKELSIKAVTVYGFSTENWNRPQEEVEAILWLIEQYAVDQREEMVSNGVRLRCIGDIANLPDTLQAALEATCRATAGCNDVEMVMALNYGSRDEILRVVNKICDEVRKGALSDAPIDEKQFSCRLDTHGLPELDLLIRPGGEYRLSNFLLWQASYAELVFLDKMWPEFTPQDLYEAVSTFQTRQRRLGT